MVSPDLVHARVSGSLVCLRARTITEQLDALLAAARSEPAYLTLLNTVLQTRGRVEAVQAHCDGHADRTLPAHMIESRPRPLDAMATHRFPLDQAEFAIRTLEGKMPGESAMCCVLLPGISETGRRAAWSQSSAPGRRAAS